MNMIYWWDKHESYEKELRQWEHKFGDGKENERELRGKARKHKKMNKRKKKKDI